MQLLVLGIKGSDNLDLVKNAIRGLTVEDAAAAVATTGLSKDLMIEAVASTGVSKEVATTAVETALLNVENTKTAFSTKNLTTALQSFGTALKAASPFILVGGLMLLSNTFSDVEGNVGNTAKIIVAAILLIGTVTLFAIKMANTEIRSFMSSNPLGWILLAITAVVVAIKAIVEAIISFANASTVAKEKAIDAAKETKEAWEDAKEALDDVNEELETARDRFEELQELSDRGTITLVEQEELDKLKETIALLETEKAVLESKEALAKENAQTAAADAVDAILNEKLSDAFVQEDNTFWKGVWRSLSSAYSWGISDAFGFGISDWSVKKVSAQSYVDSILEQMKNGEELTDQQTEYLNEFYATLQEQQDMLTYHSGDNLADWQKDANEAYNTYWEYIHKLNIANGKVDSVWNHILNMERFDGVQEELTKLANAGNVSSATLQSLYDTNSAFHEMVDYLVELGIFSWSDTSKVSGLVNQINQLADAGDATTRQIDRLSASISDYKEQIGVLKDAIDEYNESGSVSADTYNKVTALNKDYADLFDFSNGKIELAAENVDKLASELIEQYGSTLAANGATEEQIQLMVALANSIRFIASGFDELQNSYNNELSELDHLSNTYENAIQAMEKAGLRRTTTYYQKLKKVEEDRIDILNAELAALTAEFQNTILSSKVKEGSEEWNKMNSAINKVKESIQKAEIAVQDYSNTIRNIEWEYFDYQQQLNSQVTDESNFLLELMSGKDMVDDKGAFTEFGNAAMGLHGVNYGVYLKQSQQYAAELAKIEAELATNPYNQDLIDRKEELLGLQRDSILAAEDEKQAIVDLVKEGIDAQCDAMKDLIDKYKEALDSAKDLYDYQNKVSDITQEIGTLQKQIIAYENDTSEEAKAQIQQLNVDLQKAQEELQETEYDQFIADQKKLLDRLYNDYESILNQRLDDVDTLISDCITSINDGATEIQGTLGSLGTTLSSNMSTIWNTAGGVDSVVSTFNEDCDTKMTTVGTTLGNIETLVSNIKTNSTNNSAFTTNPDNSSGATNPTETEVPDYTSTKTETPTVDKEVARKAAQDYIDSHGMLEGDKNRWGQDANFLILLRQYISCGGNIDDLHGKVPAYKEGGMVNHTGFAWVDGTKTRPEAFLDAKDTQNIASLRDMLRALASDNIGISNPLYSMFEPITYQGGVPGLEDKISSLSKHTETINVENHFEITIPIDKVEDYNDFVTKLQSDPKFEKMITAMTIGRLNGGSSLAKYNYKWK